MTRITKSIAVFLLLSLVCALAFGCAKAPTEGTQPTEPVSTPDTLILPETTPVTPVYAQASPLPAAATPEVTPAATATPIPTPSSYPTQGYINKEGVNLREKADTVSAVLDILGQNATLTLVALQDGWYQVKMNDSTNAYVAQEFITPGAPPRVHNMQWAKVSVKETALYKSPGRQDVSDVKLKQGDIVKVLRKIGEDLHIVYKGTENVIQRYIPAESVTYISETEAGVVPAASAAPTP